MKFRYIRSFLLLGAVSLAGTCLTGCSSSESVSENAEQVSESVLEAEPGRDALYSETESEPESAAEAEMETAWETEPVTEVRNQTEEESERLRRQISSEYSDTLPENTARQLGVVLKAVSEHIKTLEENTDASTNPSDYGAPLSSQTEPVTEGITGITEEVSESSSADGSIGALFRDQSGQEASTRRLPDAEAESTSETSIETPETFFSETESAFEPESSASETEAANDTESSAGETEAAHEPEPSADETVTYETLIERLYPGYSFLISHPVALPQKSMSLLHARLLEMTSHFDGTWSIFVRDLSTEESLSIGDQAMPSASTMKLFIMGAVYEAFSEGTLERTQETVALLNNMISYSSNEDTNRLLYLLGEEDYARGIEAVNRYISSHGYSDYTHLYNPFQNDSLIIHPGQTNQTSARDCALLLELVYRRAFAGRSVCNEIENMLLSQTTRYKIPSGVGSEAQVGNKTGETDTVENDTAIVYTPYGDYILCIFSTGWDDKELAQSEFEPISAEVYHYFTQEDYVSAYANLPVIPGWEEETSYENVGTNLEE